MNPSTFNKLRLLAVLTTLIALVGHHFLPEKKLVIHPSGSNTATLYADDAWGGKSTATWLDPASTHWRCTLAQSEVYPVCGMAISFPEQPGGTRNFSAYDSINVRLKYVGEATKLRVYIRNHNPVYSDMTDVDSLKFNSVSLRIEDFAQSETIIHLTEFAVADWWIEERDIPREWALPEHNNVASIGVDLPFPQVFGQHDLQIERVELIGTWIPSETLYLTTIVAWMLMLGWEASSRLLLIFRRSRSDSQKIRHLTDYARVLQEQTDKYKELSTHDPLTGIFNRNGLASAVETLYSNRAESQSNNSTIILFDIDHFKRINDRRGHDAGDRILRDIASLVDSNIRDKDTFARWGGEEFIIISTGNDSDAVVQLAEKIRLLVAKHPFEPDEPLQVTVSLGAAKVNPGDSFEDTFKRADNALYKAKDLGRNCVILAE